MVALGVSWWKSYDMTSGSHWTSYPFELQKVERETNASRLEEYIRHFTLMPLNTYQHSYYVYILLKLWGSLVIA